MAVRPKRIKNRKIIATVKSLSDIVVYELRLCERLSAKQSKFCTEYLLSLGESPYVTAYLKFNN